MNTDGIISFFKRRWYTLPLLSGVALALTFYPADLWPLGFVALAPLYFFAARAASTDRMAWRGGFLSGALYAAYLASLTVLQFHWLEPAYLFAWGVRLSIIPIALLSGVLCGMVALLYRRLRGGNFLLNALMGAALFTISELFLRFLFGGFYMGTLGHVSVGLPFVLSFAAWGGEALVSFVLAACSALLAEVILAGGTRRSLVSAGACILIFLSAGTLASWYLVRSASEGMQFSVAVLQTGSRERASFGTTREGVLSFPELEEGLMRTSALAPDLTIYPFSPVEGALFRTTEGLSRGALGVREEAFGAWLAAHASGTVMTWNVVYDREYYNAYEYWEGGRVVGEYRKRELFPFLDYTPRWAKRLGLYTTPFDEVPGDGGVVRLGSVKMGSLLCSEVNHPRLAREDADTAQLIVAAGSEAMFQNGLAGDFNLRAARFRAVENNVPVVRADLLGPSALIAADGSVVAGLPYGKEGILHGKLSLGRHVSTLYSRWGDGPAWGMLLGIPLLSAFIRRRYGYQ